MLPAMSVETKVPHLVFTNSNLKFHYSLPTIIYKVTKVTCQKFKFKLTWVVVEPKKNWQKSTQQKITDGKTHLKMPGKPTQLKPTAKDEEGKKGVRDKAGRKSARGRQSSTAPLSAATTVFSLSFGCTLLAWLRAQGGNARSPPVEKRWLVIASFDYEKLLISRFLFDYRFFLW